jgi:sortase A
MRPVKTLFRFVIVAGLVLAWAAPAGAVVRPDDVSPAPARQPAFHRSQSAGVDIGRIRIPAIDLDETVRSGVAMSVIDRGVAHWAGTSSPGGSGNMVLAGHRTTKTRPFENIDRLDEGDIIFMTGGDGREIMYRVSDSFVVDPNDLWITYDGPKPSLTMFACHPKGSARFRIVVQAELVADGLIG